MVNLRKRLDGISGTSCSHSDPYGEREHFEACSQHHGAAAHQIVMQWLDSEEVFLALAEIVGGTMTQEIRDCLKGL